MRCGLLVSINIAEQSVVVKEMSNLEVEVELARRRMWNGREERHRVIYAMSCEFFDFISSQQRRRESTLAGLERRWQPADLRSQLVVCNHFPGYISRTRSRCQISQSTKGLPAFERFLMRFPGEWRASDE